MKITKDKEVTTTIIKKEVVEITCDCCRKDITEEDEGYITTEYSIDYGYGGVYREEQEVTICYDCFLDIIPLFKEANTNKNKKLKITLEDA